MLHALLVSINDYHPAAAVRSLKGCHADAAAMRLFLEKNFPHLLGPNGENLRHLADAEATRQGIIDHFRDHLAARARPGDTVLFHFSGHGAQNRTAVEFEAFDKKHWRDEGLVCHDSRLPGRFDLADKELAALLSLLPAGVEAVVVVDSCHSGSLTRSAEQDAAQQVTARFQPGDLSQPRPLDTYLGGFYRDRPRDVRILPESDHIALSACDRGESAYETEGSGIFTRNLLDVLGEGPVWPSYAELFQRVRVAIGRQGSGQTPQFATAGAFNAHRRFLGWEVPRRNSFPVFFKEEKGGSGWQLGLGTVHGLPLGDRPAGDLRFSLFEDATAQQPIATVAARSVGMDKTWLDDDGIKKPLTATLYGEPVSVPEPSINVFLKAGAAEIDLFQPHIRPRTPFAAFTANESTAAFTVELEALPGGDLRALFFQKGRPRFLTGCEGQPEAVAANVAELLEKAEKWSRLLVVRSSEAPLFETDRFEWGIDWERPDGSWAANGNAPLTVVYDGKRKVPFKVRFGRTRGAEPHWVYLFDFSRKLGVSMLGEVREIEMESGSELFSSRFFIANSDPDSVSYLKILVTSAKLGDTTVFEQAPIEGFGEIRKLPRTKGTRGEAADAMANIKGAKPLIDLNRWFTENIEVRVTRP